MGKESVIKRRKKETSLGERLAKGVKKKGA